MESMIPTHKVIIIRQGGRSFVYDSNLITYEQAQRVRAIVGHAAELMEKPPASISGFESCGLDTWKLRALSHIFVELVDGESKIIEYSPEKARVTYQFIKAYRGNFAEIEEALDHFLEFVGGSSLASLVLRRDTLLLLQKYAQVAMAQTMSSPATNIQASVDTNQTDLTN